MSHTQNKEKSSLQRLNSCLLIVVSTMLIIMSVAMITRTIQVKDLSDQLAETQEARDAAIAAYNEAVNKGKGTLYSFANTKLYELIQTNHYDHTSADGCDFDCRADKAGLDGIGENLYRAKMGSNECKYPFAYQNAFELWDKSPTHKANLDKEHSSSVMVMGQNSQYCYMVHIFQF